MGQYYVICNVTKREMIKGHFFGEGIKLMEFGMSGEGTMAALAILLADGNGRGGGDLNSDDTLANSIIGSWAGDKIVIAGDYADDGKFVTSKDVEGFVNNETKKPLKRKEMNLFHLAHEKFKDISGDAYFCLLQDSWLRDNLKKTWKENSRMADEAVKELIEIIETKEDELPLLVGRINSKEALAILERKLKGTTYHGKVQG